MSLNYKKTIAFLLLCVIVVGILSFLFYPRNNYNTDTTDSISGNTLLGEEKNSIDVVILGDSQAYSSFNPMVMNNSRISCFVTAVSAQPICETVDFAKAAFINQSPKLIIVEADVIYESCSLAKYAYTKIKQIVPILQFHDRWKKIGTKEFSLKKDFSNVDPLKGYINDSSIEPPAWDTTDYMKNETEESYIGKGAELSIKDIKRICDAYGAKLLVVSVPNLKWNYARTENVQNLCDKYEIAYLDLNTAKDMYPIDWKTESKDWGVHVNDSGAEKVSVYVSDYVVSHYFVDN